jgi:hypothetical protein
MSLAWPLRRADGTRGKLPKTDPSRYERAALRWLERFIAERLPPLTAVALAASALAELRHGHRNVGVEALKCLLHRG